MSTSPLRDLAINIAPKALVVDDSISQRLLLAHMLSEIGLDVVSASDGNEAIVEFDKEMPDIIFLDIEMPNMNGVEAARIIRKKLGDTYIPIVFVTGGASDKYLNDCIEVGGDDFINKPFNPLILGAKTQSLLRIKNLYGAQLLQKEKLQHYQTTFDLEHEVAASLYKNIVGSGLMESPNVRSELSPMAMFNGDMLLHSYTPANKLHLLLGDFTGHGITASVAAAPTSEVFYGMTSKGFGIREIVEEINFKLKRLLPPNMFLAATLLCIDRENNNLSIITCGLPDHMLFSTETGEVQDIISNNLPLGIVDNSDLNIEENHIEINSSQRLIMFTDGVIEAENAKGEQFDFSGVRNCLLTSAPDCFNNIQNALALHQGNMGQQDDITLVEVSCDLSPENWNTIEEEPKRVGAKASSWKLASTFNHDTIQRLNPIPVLVNSLMEIQGLQPFRESIFLVVTELYVNSLDHGLLNLDSSIKNSPDGFAKFFDLKDERVQNLDSGVIKIMFSHEATENGGKLTIRISDTGGGFNPESIFSDIENNEQFSGRGIMLIKQICDSLTYSNGGRQAIAVFSWSC